MTETPLQCRICGGTLEDISPDRCRCAYCGREYKKAREETAEEFIHRVLGEDKEERVNSLRRMLWDEMHAEYIDSAKVCETAGKIKEYLPDDYYANFCEAANGGSVQKLNSFLTSTSEEEDAEFAEEALDFLLRSADASCLTAASYFIDCAFKDDPKKYDEYRTRFEAVAENVKSGIYETIIPRDAFIAYSSADSAKAVELCDYLESQNISCFLSLRNLRHGKGAADSYAKALRSAMDNCKTVVFVSSVSSRRVSCDALKRELSYIKQKDIDAAPAEYKHAYERMPQRYKMPRVEYLIEDYRGDVGEKVTKEFFSGLEWCRSKEDVAERVARYISSDVSLFDGIGASASPAAAPAAREASAGAVPGGFSIRSGVLERYSGTAAHVTVPDGVSVIGSRAFAECASLRDVTLPYGLTSIGCEAFSGCVSLQSVALPSTLTEIDGYAFSGCRSLTQMTIPESVRTMGGGVFSGCTSMQTICCGAQARPAGWNELWCRCSTKIVWKPSAPGTRAQPAPVSSAPVRSGQGGGKKKRTAGAVSGTVIAVIVVIILLAIFI